MNDSLQKQLAEAKENLQLIEERKSKYVLETDIPLQLIKEEERLKLHIATLQARLAEALTAPSPSQPDHNEEARSAQLLKESPYRGLEPFEARHAEFYFGRATMVDRLVAKVKDNHFVAVVGSSGCGKSSMVRAGLVTALGSGVLPGSQTWAVRFFRPGPDPLRSLSTPLAALLEAGTNEIERIALIRELADYLRNGKFTLADVAAQLHEKRPDLPRLVLVADQFEELYTECRDEALREAFIKTLLSGTTEPNLVLVLTLRADFYGHVLDHRELGQAVDVGLLNVLPMNEEELRLAIEQPALKTERDFESGLVDRILGDVTEQPGNLPLLEFALAELWQRQTANGLLTHSAYDAIGGVAGAIAGQAEAVYEELDTQNQGNTVQRIFLRLTHYSEGVKSTRRQAAMDDLVTPGTPRDAVEEVVMTLAGARLLVTGRAEESKAATVEVAHEALIRGWDRLKSWLDQDRAFGLWRERLAVARQIWVETQYDEGAILRGAPLSEAEGWLDGRGNDLNEAERTFIEESLSWRERVATEREARRQRELEAARRLTEETEARRKAETQRAQEAEQAATRLRLRNRIAIGLGLVALVAAIAAIWFGSQASLNLITAQRERNAAERQASINAARELKARALVQINANAECALILAMEGYNQASAIPDFSPYEFEDVVRKTLLQTHVLATFVGHGSPVNSVAWSPDGQQVASAGEDYTVRIWDVEKGENIFTLNHTNFVFDVAWSPDGQQLTSAVGDGTVQVWDANTGEAIVTLTGHTEEVRAVAYSPDGHMLASASDDTTVRLWDVSTGLNTRVYMGENIATLIGHTSEIYDVAWSPDGQWLASASLDTQRIWDVKTENAVAIFKNRSGQALSVTWSPDGQQLASALADGKIQIWDVKAEELIVTLTGHSASVWSVAWSPDGQWLASAGEDSTIRLWNVSTRPNMVGETIENMLTLSGHTNMVRRVNWSPDGQQLASASNDGTARVWDLESGESVKVWTTPADNLGLTDAAWSPDGQWLAVANTYLSYSEIQVWNTDTGENTSISTNHTSTIQRITWSPDSSRLASASADNTIHLYDVDSGEHLATLSGHNDRIYDITWSPDGQQLASVGEDTIVRLWDANTGQNTATLTNHRNIIFGVAWSPGGQQLASASYDGTVRLWDVNNGENTLVLNSPEGSLASVTWSPDEQWVASGATSGTIIIWDANSGEQITMLRGHSAIVWDLAWNPSATQLASASNDGTARLWDTTTWETIAEFTGHTGAVRAITWSPSGQRLATAGQLDHTIRIYYANFEQDVLPIARTQLERGSTPEERAACISQQ